VQGLSKRGVDVTYVGGSTSVLAVGGFCQAGNVAVWDTLAPVKAGPIARLSHHASMVTALQVFPLPFLTLTPPPFSGREMHPPIAQMGFIGGGKKYLVHMTPWRSNYVLGLN